MTRAATYTRGDVVAATPTSFNAGVMRQIAEPVSGSPFVVAASAAYEPTNRA
ncbi:MAG: hypothetical protein JOZ62_16430 [Acidobacteriaceae bacterium]|nr:hypothetical protein [Acidobacteriaceae bacterium]